MKLIKGLFDKKLDLQLASANKLFKPIRIDEDSNFRVWGVVIYVIRKWK